MQIDDPRRRPATQTAPAFDRAVLRARLPLVHKLSGAHQAIVMEAGEVQRHRAGTVFCAARREQEWVYYLLEGKVTATGPDQVPRDFEAVTTGIYDCLHGPGQRCVSARARTDVTVFRIPQATLGRYINLSSVQAAALPDVVELGASDSADGLELALSIGVLARLPPSDIQRLLQRSAEIPVRAGEVILQQGEEADACFIVKVGVAEVDVERHGGTQYRVALKGPGEFFGEEALLAGNSRGATVRMRSDGVLIRIEKAEFRRYIVPTYVQPLSRERAEAFVAEGAAWLDMREPADFQHASLPNAINLPLAILRLRCTSLDPRQRYIVCSGDPAYSSLGNFLLSAAGLDAYYLDVRLDRLEITNRLELTATLDEELSQTADGALPFEPEDAMAPARADSTNPDAPPATEDTIQIGLEDVRNVERKRYQRRLRKAVAHLQAEAEARVRAAVQEVEMNYLNELENKHRQVLELKRKVAQQQREIWKLRQASLKQAAPSESAEQWPPPKSQDSI